jgi:sigma54-dependent transcription regulator
MQRVRYAKKAISVLCPDLNLEPVVLIDRSRILHDSLQLRMIEVLQDEIVVVSPNCSPS